MMTPDEIGSTTDLPWLNSRIRDEEASRSMPSPGRSYLPSTTGSNTNDRKPMRLHDYNPSLEVPSRIASRPILSQEESLFLQQRPTHSIHTTNCPAVHQRPLPTRGDFSFLESPPASTSAVAMSFPTSFPSSTVSVNADAFAETAQQRQRSKIAALRQRQLHYQQQQQKQAILQDNIAHHQQHLNLHHHHHHHHVDAFATFAPGTSLPLASTVHERQQQMDVAIVIEQHRWQQRQRQLMLLEEENQLLQRQLLLHDQRFSRPPSLLSTPFASEAQEKKRDVPERVDSCVATTTVAASPPARKSRAFAAPTAKAEQKIVSGVSNGNNDDFHRLFSSSSKTSSPMRSVAATDNAATTQAPPRWMTNTDKQEKVSSPMVKGPCLSKIRRMDVVCAKGRGSHELLPGNKFYRHLLMELQPEYLNADQYHRPAIMAGLLERLQSKKSWFIEPQYRDSKKGWYLGPDRVRKKVSDDLQRSIRRPRETRTMYFDRKRAMKAAIKMTLERQKQERAKLQKVGARSSLKFLQPQSRNLHQPEEEEEEEEEYSKKKEHDEYYTDGNDSANSDRNVVPPTQHDFGRSDGSECGLTSNQNDCRSESGENGVHSNRIVDPTSNNNSIVSASSCWDDPPRESRAATAVVVAASSTCTTQ